MRVYKSVNLVQLATQLAALSATMILFARRCYTLLLLATTLLFPSSAQRQSPSISESLEADIYLGGLFPVHSNEDNRCGKILDLGVQRMEAMIFAWRR